MFNSFNSDQRRWVVLISLNNIKIEKYHQFRWKHICVWFYYLFIYLFIYLSIHLFIYLFICFFMTSIVFFQYVERWIFFVTYFFILLLISYQLCNSELIFKQNSNISSHVHCIHCDIQFYEFKSNENAYRKHYEYSSTYFWIIIIKKRFVSKAKFIWNEIAISIFKSVIVKSTSFFTSKQSSVASIESSKTMIAMLTSFVTFLSNESTLMFTLFVISSKTISKISFFDISFITSKQSFIASIATSKKQIFSTEIVSRLVVASKSLRFSIFAFKLASKALKIALIVRLSVSHQISISKHQKHKFYFIIQNLFEMFVEKSKRTNLLHIKKRESFSKFSRQIKITVYFKFVINQKKSISQNSKISNSKIFYQFMFAKMIRIKFLFFRKTTSKKSIVLLYKMFFIFDDISFTFVFNFYKNHAFNENFNFCNQWIKIHQINQSETLFIKFNSKFERIYVEQYVDRHVSNISLIILIKKINFHTCRRCFRIFRFNNDLHEHFRCIHLKYRHRRFIERIFRVETNRRSNQSWRKI